MVKQGIKNYFKNLKYLFVPLGMLALGFVIGLSILIPGVVDSVSDLSDNVVEISGNASLDFDAFKGDLVSAVGALDWDDPISALKQMLNADWLTETFNTCITALLGDTTECAVQIGECINVCIAEISSFVKIVIVFAVLGLIGGYYLTKTLIRRNIARRAFWKFFLVALVDSVLNVTLVAVCVWLLSLWKPSVFISSAISLFLFGFIALLEAYLVHGYKKTDRKKIVNIKNIAKLFLSDLIIFVLSLIFISVIVALFNELVGLFVGVALVEIAFIIISLNAEAYVKSVVLKEENRQLDYSLVEEFDEGYSNDGTTDSELTHSQSESDSVSPDMPIVDSEKNDCDVVVAGDSVGAVGTDGKSSKTDALDGGQSVLISKDNINAKVERSENRQEEFSIKKYVESDTEVDKRN